VNTSIANANFVDEAIAASEKNEPNDDFFPPEPGRPIEGDNVGVPQSSSPSLSDSIPLRSGAGLRGSGFLAG